MDSMTNENVEWGPAIPVEGKRPEWLKDDNLRIDVRWGDVSYIDDKQKEGAPANCVVWGGTTAIRLPANHPHYATPTRTALEQRMEDLARALACVPRDSVLGQSGYASEARAILAELEPVDGDLTAAVKLLLGLGFGPTHPDWETIRNATVTAIKHGRSLERGGE